uniref:Uncharacterized protein n=1 Tax=Nelumbo nucifera TaxID=4432 RepID=A0A822YWB1_NELNU|nr:TPA_asm: hypothetical protein HUJ06_006065 [Nelumbo nucifera]
MPTKGKVVSYAQSEGKTRLNNIPTKIFTGIRTCRQC